MTSKSLEETKVDNKLRPENEIAVSLLKMQLDENKELLKSSIKTNLSQKDEICSLKRFQDKILFQNYILLFLLISTIITLIYYLYKT